MKIKFKIFRIFLLLFTLSITLGQFAFCEATKEQTPFIYGLHGTPPGFDPLGVYDGTSGDVLLNHVEGLYAFNYSDPQLGIIPRLAADMGSWNAEGTEWTISLRDDVRWHDGTAFTASDVKWNWDRLNRLSTSYLCHHSSLWYNNDADLILNKTEVIDDHTIKFTLNKEWKDFEFLQTFWGCALIKPIYGKEETTISNDEYQLIIGTGPFVLDEYTSGENTTFVANNDYYRGAPDIQKLIFKAYGSTTAAMNALMEQECHVVRHVYADTWESFDTDPNLNYQHQKMAVCFFFHINTHTIPLAARKAMQYAFNYSYLIENTMDSTVAEIHTPVPDGMMGHNPDLPGLPYYNITKARQFLLDDPTYGAYLSNNNITINNPDEDWIALASSHPIETINFSTYGTGFEAQVIDNMKYIGIRIIENQWGCWGEPVFAASRAGKALLMGGWSPDYWHPINQIEPIYRTNASSNNLQFSNETIDQWIEEAHVLQGEDLQKKIDQIVTGIMVDNAAAIYIYQRIHVIGWSAKFVSNVNDLMNASGDKYFYNVQFALSKAPSTGIQLNIPGYSPLLFFLSCLGISSIMLLFNSKRCKKRRNYTNI
jgi:ABC-type transport system substrate-binding protein